MSKKIYLNLFLIAVLNSVMVFLFPNYSFFIFPLILFLSALICVAIVVIDLFDKTHLWKGAFYALGMGILSWLLGLYFQDFFYYSI